MTNYIGSEPVFADNTQAMLDLEAMIDAAGIRNMLHALEHIALVKARHVNHVWEDHNLAEAWRRIAHIAGSTASNPSLDFSELWEVEGFIKRLLARNSENEERLILEAITHLREFSKQETMLRGRIWKLEAEIERLRNNGERRFTV